MNKNMMRRRTALTLSLGLLASCSAPKAKINGTQIPVMPEISGLESAVDAPAVTVPPAITLNDWPQSLANPTHAPGNIAGPTGFARKFSTSIGIPGGYRQPLQASPVMAGGSIYTMDANGEISKISATDGAQAWRHITRPKHATEQNIGGGIAYDSGRLYASTGYGELLALDAGSGNVIWRQKLDFPTRTAPMVAGGLVALVVQNDLLLTFDAGTGTPGWRFTGTVGTPSVAAVAVTGAPAFADGILVAGFSNGMVAALDANSGTPIWEQSLAFSFGQSSVSFSDIVAAPVISGGVVYVIGLGNTVLAVDLHSGNKVWTHAATGTQAFCLAGGFAYLLDQNQNLFAIHADDGLVSWQLALPAFHNKKTKKGPILWAGPVMINGLLILTSDQGQAALVDPVAGTIQSTVKLGAPADMPPIAANGLLLQLTRDAKLTAYG
jgi:outer membrane protein assembly factor BamB